MTMKLQELDILPQEILQATPETLHTILKKPTLVHLPGEKQQPVFISVLLHGNEPTGFLALQKLLKKYAQKPLPRSISIFFGNTEAAQYGLRRLDNQPDFNRVWPGTELEDCAETRLMQTIFDKIKARQPFASIDIHNNTGLNPHYACINKLDSPFLQLASLFGRLIVFFTRPEGVQSNAFAKICPAVTLECGRPGQQYGVDHAFEYLDSCLHLTELTNHPVSNRDIAVYHTVAQVKIKENIRFSFNDPDAELLLDKDLEKLNFTEIQQGTRFGIVKNPKNLPLEAINEKGQSVTEHFFKTTDHELQNKRTTMPSMLTLDERVIRQDCLCYLMEKIEI